MEVAEETWVETWEAAVAAAMAAPDPGNALIGLLLAPRPSEEEQAAVEIAVACASPLCDVLCKAVAEVDAAVAPALLALREAAAARRSLQHTLTT